MNTKRVLWNNTSALSAVSEAIDTLQLFVILIIVSWFNELEMSAQYLMILIVLII